MKHSNYLKLVLFLLIVLGVESCNKLGRDEVDSLLMEIGVDEINSQVKFIVVIPGQGCSGCLQAARAFMKENYTDERFEFVLTKFDSRNQLRIIYGSKVLEGAKLDRSDVFYNGGFNTMYPAIITVGNGAQFKIRLADPDHYDLWEEILK